MTDAQFLAWLKDPSATRVVLIEANALAGGVETTFYMSTKGGYTTSPSDAPSNTFYKPIAEVGVLYTEEISLTNDSASLNAGSIEITNYTGERDEWLSHVWSNRNVKAWVGDPSWSRADFRMIFNGVAADVVPNGKSKLSLKLRDKMQLLNAALTEEKLGGSTENKDNVIPLTFGECHNVNPLLIDPVNLIYQVHNGPIERIIKVRDNGVPITVAPNLTNGTFKLANQSFGTVTVSVQGDKNVAYTNNIGATIKRIVKSYGKASDRFTDNDIDLANFTSFDAANTQAIGFYASDRINVLEACRQVANSVGAQLVMTRLGKLQLIQLNLPATGTPTEIHKKHMVNETIEPVEKILPKAAIKIGFNKNWVPQEELLTNIKQQHKDLFQQEWLTATAVDTAVQAIYKQSGEPVQEDTLLLTRIDAQAEAQRRLNLWKVPRQVYEFEGTPEMLSLTLGQPIKVFHHRFGMSAGVVGTVISLAPNWMNGHVKVRFIV